MQRTGSASLRSACQPLMPDGGRPEIPTGINHLNYIRNTKGRTYSVIANNSPNDGAIIKPIPTQALGAVSFQRP